jgi:predicted ribosome quality control (RQC) complex YloA/Tae2 family protein
MKLRKHINNKRLEKLTMIQNDRIIDLQFGSGDAAQHLVSFFVFFSRRFYVMSVLFHETKTNL